MKIASLANVKARLNAYIKQCQTEGPIVITQNGQAVAALLVPMHDDLERLILAHSPRFHALLAKSHASIKAGKGLSSDEFWKAVKQRRRAKSKAKQTSRKT